MLFLMEIWVLAASVAAIIVLARMGNRGFLGKLLRHDLAAASIVSVIVCGIIYGLIGTWFALSPLIGSVAIETSGMVVLVVALVATAALAAYKNPAAPAAG